MPKPQIDISLDGVGAQQEQRSPIDIPLDKKPPKAHSSDDITNAELEFVNRHHEQYKELRRRAREQGGR